ncbi:MAG: amidohydrolase family protein [Eubacteriales bacterium]|nr:amidohydrolase family protein [Eubacteriales bacterium]
MIDFHTHMFPDKIAHKTIAKLTEYNKASAYTDGTAQGLRASTIEAGIDCAIVLPVATKPEQFESINHYAMQFRGDHLLSFGGIHPDTEDYNEKLQYLKANGFLGIKLHPDYQSTFINDIHYKRIISCASELGLIVSVHAGYDPSSPDIRYCSPELVLDLYEDVKPEKLVLAHMGGYRMWDDVEKYLTGLPVWFDTGVIFRNDDQASKESMTCISDEQFIRISRKHGIEKILFASDCPWASQKEFIAHVRALDMKEEEKQMIFHTNAENLLGIKVMQESHQNK